MKRPFLVRHQVSCQAGLHCRYQLESRSGHPVNPFCQHHLDARLHGESYRTIAEVLLGFQGTKEDFESDPRKNKARRLVAHGVRMMRGGYRLLLHYPIKLPK
ncbi:MAG: DUF2285 domain-containing protein [Paracoccus aminovorans]|nr:DUF2285 domain-containing protein [Paracoccus aminovorans]